VTGGDTLIGMTGEVVDVDTPDADADVWDQLMAMNLKGMFMTIKHVLPVMREQMVGSIINVSSTASVSVSNTVTYKTSKGAVNTMTQHLAMENAPFGVRANAILPVSLAVAKAAARMHASRFNSIRRA